MYNILSTPVFRDGDYWVTSLREQDMPFIKVWRNEQIDALRQKKILTDDDQRAYFQKVVSPSFTQIAPTLVLFSFFHQNQLIGYGGLTNLIWEDKRCELSFLVDTARTQNPALYTADFSAFIQLMKQVAFNELNLHRIFTETYDIRPLHISILEANGFRLEGRMKDHVVINQKFTDSLLHGLLNQHE